MSHDDHSALHAYRHICLLDPYVNESLRQQDRRRIIQDLIHFLEVKSNGSIRLSIVIKENSTTEEIDTSEICKHLTDYYYNNPRELGKDLFSSQPTEIKKLILAVLPEVMKTRPTGYTLPIKSTKEDNEPANSLNRDLAYPAWYNGEYVDYDMLVQTLKMLKLVNKEIYRMKPMNDLSLPMATALFTLAMGAMYEPEFAGFTILQRDTRKGPIMDKYNVNRSLKGEPRYKVLMQVRRFYAFGKDLDVEKGTATGTDPIPAEAYFTKRKDIVYLEMTPSEKLKRHILTSKIKSAKSILSEYNPNNNNNNATTPGEGDVISMKRSEFFESNKYPWHTHGDVWHDKYSPNIHDPKRTMDLAKYIARLTHRTTNEDPNGEDDYVDPDEVSSGESDEEEVDEDEEDDHVYAKPVGKYKKIPLDTSDETLWDGRWTLYQNKQQHFINAMADKVKISDEIDKNIHPEKYSLLKVPPPSMIQTEGEYSLNGSKLSTIVASTSSVEDNGLNRNSKKRLVDTGSARIMKPKHLLTLINYMIHEYVQPGDLSTLAIVLHPVLGSIRVTHINNGHADESVMLRADAFGVAGYIKTVALISGVATENKPNYYSPGALLFRSSLTYIQQHNRDTPYNGGIDKGIGYDQKAITYHGTNVMHETSLSASQLITVDNHMFPLLTRGVWSNDQVGTSTIRMNGVKSLITSSAVTIQS